MRKFLSLLIALFALSAAGYSQAPGIFNYQGVARNSVGNVLKNQAINLRLSIHDGTAAGPVVYQESRTVLTNPFGLFNAQVGGPGGVNVSGTIAGVDWEVGPKFIQVEIDPAGGTSFINIGTAQLASVPYSLYSTTAGDLVLPFSKAQSELVPLFRIANTGNGAGSIAIEGSTASTAGLANGVVGTVTSASPGGFSAGVRGINNGTGGLGIGVYGSQNGSGWGVYGITPSGFGVYGATTTGMGVRGEATGTGGTGVFGTSSTGNAGRFEITNNANNTDALVAATNGGAASWALRAGSTGAQGAGIFTYNNAAGAANAVRITNNGSGAGISVSQTGTGSAGVFATTGTGTIPTVTATNSSLAGNAFTIVGEISATNPGGFSAGVRGINNGTGGLGIGVWGSQAGSGWGVYGTANGGIGVNGSASSGIGVNGTSNTGTGGRFTTTSGLALHSTGGVRLEGIGEAANRVLTSDAAGNATWQALGGGVGIGGSGTLNFISKWTPDGTNLGNSLLFDNGTSVGLGTITPTHRFNVSHGGSTGIGVTSTSGFSVVDIDAASGDAALRFANNGVNQWNIRNQPGTDNLQIFELGGGGERMSIQNATGNIAIGGSTGAYRLDILHGGSTGILNKSSSSFSVLDIDAFTGDAAIRLANNGVNQWNIRNQPGTDNLQIFELGGGGERFVIENGTGNVSIGAGGTPAYRLDILHGGSTGIRNKSTGSYSAFDLDAATGDAAIRLLDNGTSMWNFRMQPGTNNLQWFELGGGGERMLLERGTGNLSLGAGGTPTYKLDILHGGSTGIRNKSTSSYSAFDIDGATGDAAIRFANNGTNMWNVRNQPGTNNFQIFELGGGGERFSIEDATGNIAIGNATPTHKVHVLHSGSTGIKVESSASFSVVDIDASNGDAALRYQRNGTNMWNVRNNPVSDDYEIFELGSGSRFRIQDGTGFVGINNSTPTVQLHVNGDFTATGAKMFTIDHPLDPENKMLRHFAVESNEVMNSYSGNITTDASGKAVVQLPDYFESINKDFRYQLTVIGSFAQAIISKKISNNRFEIATNQPNIEVSWEIKGVRNDAYMQNEFKLKTEDVKPANMKGRYFSPKAYNQPESKGMNAEDVKNTSADQSTLKKSSPPVREEENSGSLVPVSPSTKTLPAAASTGGSLEMPAEKKPARQGDNITGSVEDKPKAELKKPVTDNKGSVEESPKPAEEKKAPASTGSTRTE